MSTYACHVRTRTPCAHLVRRDVPGAPRPRNDIGDDIRGAHGHAGRRGRRTLPRPAPCPPTHATSAHARHARTHGRARRPRRAAPTGRPRDDIGDAHGDAGRRGRRPLPRTAPCPHTHATSAHAHRAPHTHAMRAPGRARRPQRAAPTGRHREHSMDYFMSTTTLKKLKSSSLSKISVQLGSERWTFPNFR